MPNKLPAFKFGSVVYYNFGPPSESRADEGLLKEKHYAVVAQTNSLSGSDTYSTLVVAG